MQDRITVNPGRVLISPENGAAYYATMTRADNATQEGTPLNKNSLLRDATAAFFGLGADAVPDDVFRTLSRFQNNLGNEYVWAKIGKTVSLGSAQSDKAIYIYKTLYYSDSITDSGELINPQYNGAFSIMTQEAVMAELKSLTGKYFYFTGSGTTTLATLIPDDTVFYMESCNPVVVANSDNSLYTGAVYRSVSVIVDTTYVNSPWADTYPPAASDGYTYSALGRLGNKVQIATGSYTGTGTYGKANRTSLTLNFVPKLVIVARKVMDTLEGGQEVRQMDFMVLHPALGGFAMYVFTSSLSNVRSVGSDVSGNTFSWWANDVKAQMNDSGQTYTYTAIG